MFDSRNVTLHYNVKLLKSHFKNSTIVTFSSHIKNI